jgi:O-antigen/teichoic acid export membrane protein
LAQLLERALDRVDDLWTGSRLGGLSLGFYSKAYEFATYPRRVLSRSINVVATGTYAELKEDRLRMSKAFFRTNAFLVRSGFLFGGLIALAAPEFIRLVLGEKWLPMMGAFRLMLVFTLLDPIKVTVADLFTAVGRPEQVVRARVLQLLVLIVGLISLEPWFGIAGVALAVDLMLVVGIAALLRHARTHVDFSLRRLFLAPALALVLGLLLGLGTRAVPGLAGSDWLSGSVKTVVFSAVYSIVLLLLEFRQAVEMLSSLSATRLIRRLRAR